MRNNFNRSHNAPLLGNNLSRTVLVKSKEEFSPVLGELNQKEESKGSKEGGNGSASNNTGAINQMLKKLDHNPGGFMAPQATTHKNLVTRPTGAKSILLQSNSPMAAA